MPRLTDLYLQIHPMPYSPDPKSFILEIGQVNPRQLAPTMGTRGVGIMNSTAFSLLANSNPEVDGNQISFGTVDFQPHPPNLTPVFASLDQEMDLTIGSMNFRVKSLGLICLSDLAKPDPSASETKTIAMSESSVGSSSEVNSPVSFATTENTEEKIEELDEAMENLNLGDQLEDFIIYYDDISDKSLDTWKTGLELHEDKEIILSNSIGKFDNRYQVLAIVGDNSKELDDNNNPVLNQQI
jgi:hypothetical protein